MSVPADEFVERVRVALKADNANQLADRLGLGAAGGQRVARWLRGENEPDYRSTMLMLERTGWLAMRTRASAPKDRLAELGAAVAEVLRNQKEGLAILQVLRELLEPPSEDAPAQPKRPRR